MRSYDEIYSTARDVPPFSNGTEFSAWSENWCYAPCHNPAELAWQRYENGERKTRPKDFPGGCPLLLVAMMDRTPTEWLEQDSTDGIRIGDQYHCIEYRGPDDGGGDPPRPKRDPPNMDGLFERPQRSVRMLKQAEALQEVTEYAYS